MSSNRKPVRWLALAMAATLFLSGWAHPAAAFTDKQVREIFDVLGGTDGKVTNVDFQMNKINAMFFRHRKRDQRHMRFTYEETLFSRAFFDKADSGHKGYLDALDVTNAIRFDDIDTRHRGYFEYADLVAYLKKDRPIRSQPKWLGDSAGSTGNGYWLARCRNWRLPITHSSGGLLA